MSCRMVATASRTAVCLRIPLDGATCPDFSFGVWRVGSTASSSLTSRLLSVSISPSSGRSSAKAWSGSSSKLNLSNLVTISAMVGRHSGCGCVISLIKVHIVSVIHRSADGVFGRAGRFPCNNIYQIEGLAAALPYGIWPLRSWRDK